MVGGVRVEGVGAPAGFTTDNEDSIILDGTPPRQGNRVLVRGTETARLRFWYRVLARWPRLCSFFCSIIIPVLIGAPLGPAIATLALEDWGLVWPKISISCALLLIIFQGRLRKTHWYRAMLMGRFDLAWTAQEGPPLIGGNPEAIMQGTVEQGMVRPGVMVTEHHAAREGVHEVAPAVPSPESLAELHRARPGMGHTVQDGRLVRKEVGPQDVEGVGWTIQGEIDQHTRQALQRVLGDPEFEQQLTDQIRDHLITGNPFPANLGQPVQQVVPMNAATAGVAEQAWQAQQFQRQRNIVRRHTEDVLGALVGGAAGWVAGGAVPPPQRLGGVHVGPRNPTADARRRNADAQLREALLENTELRAEFARTRAQILLQAHPELRQNQP